MTVVSEPPAHPASYEGREVIITTGAVLGLAVRVPMQEDEPCDLEPSSAVTGFAASSGHQTPVSSSFPAEGTCTRVQVTSWTDDGLGGWRLLLGLPVKQPADRPKPPAPPQRTAPLTFSDGSYRC